MWHVKACPTLFILNPPEIMNMIPPIIAVVAFSCMPSMKRVHFIPTVEIISATAERKRLNSITALVAWTSAGGGEVWTWNVGNFSFIQSVCAGHHLCLWLPSHFTIFSEYNNYEVQFDSILHKLCHIHKIMKYKREIGNQQYTNSGLQYLNSRKADTNIHYIPVWIRLGPWGQRSNFWLIIATYCKWKASQKAVSGFQGIELTWQLQQRLVYFTGSSFIAAAAHPQALIDAVRLALSLLLPLHHESSGNSGSDSAQWDEETQEL